VIIETFHNRKTKWKQEVQNNFCLHAKLKNENGVVFGDIIVEQMKKYISNQFEGMVFLLLAQVGLQALKNICREIKKPSNHLKPH
jgi:hypothetical protein